MNSTTSVGSAANRRNISSEMTPGAVAKLARYSFGNSPHSHRTEISAGNNIANATRPIGIVEPRVRGMLKRRITHREDHRDQHDDGFEEQGRYATERGIAQSSRIGSQYPFENKAEQVDQPGLQSTPG